MVVRLPSAECYAAQIDQEQRWLPWLATQLPLALPVPLAIGEPGAGYPWRWSICRWLEGEPASSTRNVDLDLLALWKALITLADELPTRADTADRTRTLVARTLC